jgi:dolichyl-phosphate-mannose-protein mannosyltransferase
VAPMLVLGWWCLLALANARWIEGHVLGLPPPWDPALAHLVGLRVFQALQEGGLNAAWSEIHARSPYGPVFFPLSSIPLYWAFGATRAVAHVTTSLYLLLHLAAVFLFTRRLRGDGAGLLAVFLFSTFGAVVNLSRDYLHDFPAAAFVALALFALASSEGLSRTRSAAVFGACTGLAAITKSMAPIFVAAPLLYVLARQVRRGPRPHAGAVAAALAAAALVALPWWGRHAGSALWYLWHYGMAEGASAFAPSGTQLLSLRSVTYYSVALVNDAMSLPFAVIALGVFAASVLRARALPSGTHGLLWAWLLAGYAALTLSVNKTPDRYPIFLLTPIAALLAAGIVGIRRGRAIVLAGVVITGMWSWLAWTLEGVWTPPVIFYRPPFSLHPFHPHHAWIRSLLDIPEGAWPDEEAVRRLASMAPELKSRSSHGYATRHDATAAPEQQVRAAFLALLGREPDERTALVYAGKLREGRPASEMLREIEASEEFHRRPLRVAVAIDHPLINAATLNYYAAAARAAVAFVTLPQQPDLPWRFAVDGIAVADTNDRMLKQLRTRLTAESSGYERVLTQRCPDGSVLEVYASPRLLTLRDSST